MPFIEVTDNQNNPLLLRVSEISAVGVGSVAGEEVVVCMRNGDLYKIKESISVVSKLLNGDKYGKEIGPR